MILAATLDLDGTIYLGNRVFPETLPFLAALSELGIGDSFLTNNSSRSTDHYLRFLRELGVEAEEAAVFTSTDATVAHLQEEMPQSKRLFVLGTLEMRDEVSQQGFVLTEDDPDDEPDAVVVAFDSALTYQRLCRAAYWIGQGKPYIATHPDRVCPSDDKNLLIDCGSICAALHCATGRQPDVVAGKPERRMLTGLMHRLGLEPSQVAMVGDRLYTDMAMARAADALGVLVLTGETTRDDLANTDHQPDLVVEDLGELEQLARSCGPRRG